MARALELAEQGRGAVEPNPMVGAVIVREGTILGEGFHSRFGGPHAEIEALQEARSSGNDVRGATMYVTLEPCSDFPEKKTPPCCDALIEAGLARVVVAMVDPDERVAGRGLSVLRQAGLALSVGVMEEEAKTLLNGYCKLRSLSRPWVICKWAQTEDGYLALPPEQGRWISGQESRNFVHWLRSWCDGVCVGIGTVEADDPLLTNRCGSGKHPTRVVLDSRLRISPDCKLIATARTTPVLVATSPQAVDRRTEHADALRQAGAELLPCPTETTGGESVSLNYLLDELGRRKWMYLLVEGGSDVLHNFIRENLADELLAFVAPTRLGPGKDLPRFDVAVLDLEEYSVEKPLRIGFDQLQKFVRRD